MAGDAARTGARAPRGHGLQLAVGPGPRAGRGVLSAARPAGLAGLLALVAVAAGCHDWDRFSAHIDDDGAPPDAGDPCAGGGDPVCPAGALLCDSFETDWRPEWTKTANPDGAIVEVSQSCPYRGAWSLHLAEPALDAGSGGQAALWAVDQATQADVFMRAYLYFPGPTSTNQLAVMARLQDLSPQSQVVLKIDDDVLVVRDQLSGNLYTPLPDSPNVPLDRWVCLEWEVKTGAGALIQAWIDGQQALLADSITLDPSPPLARSVIELGPFNVTAAEPAREVYWDEAVVATTRIGCL